MKYSRTLVLKWLLAELLTFSKMSSSKRYMHEKINAFWAGGDNDKIANSPAKYWQGQTGADV